MLVNHISAFARNMQMVGGITIIGQYFKKKRATANSKPYEQLHRRSGDGSSNSGKQNHCESLLVK